MMHSHGSSDPLIGLRTSDVSERILAHLIDLLIVSAIQLLLSIPILLTTSLESLMGLMLLLSSIPIVLVLYFTLLEGLTSTTVGKRALGLRVISLSEMRAVSMRESFVRNLFRLSDMLTLYLSLLILRGGRRIGDSLAGTAVVSEKFIRVELPKGESQLARELRRSILRALLPELEVSLRELKGMRIETSLRDQVAEILRDQGDEELVDKLTYLILNPSLQISLLGAEGIARVYERAAELCGDGFGDVLRSRAMIIRAFLSRKAERTCGLSYVLREAPKEFRSSAGYFLLSFILFMLSSLLAYYLRPEWMESLIREFFGRDLVPGELNPLALSSLIFLNNLRVVIVTLGTAPLLFMPLVTLVTNGILVGLVTSLQDPIRVALLILPHGIPELTSIFMATSISMRTFRQLLRGGERWSNASSVVMGSVNLTVLSLILLLYAALVEGFLTRWLSNNQALDIAFSMAEFLLIYSYLLLPGIRSSRGS